MYPFQVILIGTGEELDGVGRALQSRSVPVAARYPTVADAIAGLPPMSAATRLFVVSLPGAGGVRSLQQLSAAQAGQPVVALLGPDADRDTVIAAMRAGAAQVALLPLNADELHTALDSVAVQFGHRSGLAQLIAVCGITGGTSTLAISVNLAYEIADQLRRDCILVEYSNRFGKLGPMLGLQPRFTTRDLAVPGGDPDTHLVAKVLTP